MFGRRGRRCKLLLDELKKMRGYWKLTEEVLDGILGRIRVVRDHGPVVKQRNELMN